MELGAAIGTGLLLGLSSGGQCFWSCASVLGPFMVVTSDEPQVVITRRSPRWTSVPASLKVLAWYNLGRLVAYLLTALIVSSIARSGALLPTPVLAGAQLLTAALLLYALLRPATKQRCWTPKRRSSSALVIGLLQGVMPCPPFITAIALALGAPGVASGVALFLALFVGTALFTLPLAFIEPLRRRRWLTVVVKVLGVGVCAYLVISALWMLLAASPGG